MPVNVRCTNPSCRQRFVVPENLAGKKGRCSTCQHTFLLTPEGSAPPPAEGKQRIGRFEVKSKLGAGAFGTVYRAWDPQLEREVALKVPNAAVLDSPRRIERFLREAKAAAGLRHPNIVPVYDAGEDGETRYIASAFVEGKPLSSLVEGEKGIDFARAARLVRQLAEGVFYAHQLGIVHRDIKPANVMLDADDRPHLMDFGLAAKLESTEKMTQDGAVLGTPAYMAPEQAAGQQGEAKPQSDQYALGVVLYELITGRTPFEGPPQIVLFNVLNMEAPPPRKLRKDVPRDLETICLKAMARRPDDRYPDCQSLADDLGRWLEGEPIRARRLTLVERAVRWVRREPKLAISAGLLAASLLALVTAAGVYMTRHYADLYTREQAEHGGTRQKLTDAETVAEAEKKRADEEKAAAQKAKAEVQLGHLAAAQARLAADDPTEAYRTLLRCDVRAFPWHQLRLQSEGTGAAVRTLKRAAGEEWGGIARIGFHEGKVIGVGRDNQFLAWDLATGKPTRTKPLTKHDGFARATSLSDDGKYAAAVIGDHGRSPGPGGPPAAEPKPTLVVVWDTATGDKVFTAPVPRGDNTFVAINGDRVAVVSMTWNPQAHTYRAWSVPHGKPVKGIESLTTPVRNGITLSPDGRTLLALAGDWTSAGKALFVEVDSGKVLEPLKDVPEAVTSLRYSADGKWVIGSGGGMRMYTESMPVTAIEKRTRKLPDGKEVVEDVTVTKLVSVSKMAAGGEAQARIWDAKTGELRATIPGCGGVGHGGGGMAVADVSPDGQLLAIVCSSHCSGAPEVLLYDLDAARRVLVLPVPERRGLFQVRFSPDGKHLAATDGSAVLVWATEGGRLLRQYDGHGGTVDALAFSPDGKFVASFSACLQTGRVWEALTGKELVAAIYPGHPTALPMTFLSDGRRVMTPPTFMGLTVYDRETGKEVEWPKEIGRVIAVSPDGKVVVAAPAFPKFEPGKPPPAIDPATNKLTVREADTGKEVASLDGWEPMGVMAQFTPDGKGLILSQSGYGGSGRLELRDETFKKVLVRHEGATADFALSADGRWLASVHQPPPRGVPPGVIIPKKEAKADADEVTVPVSADDVPGEMPPQPVAELRLFDTRTGKVIHTLKGKGKEPSISRLRFVGERLIGYPGQPWETPRRVAVWGVKTGKLVLETDCAGEAAVSPDGNWLAVPVGGKTPEPPFARPLMPGEAHAPRAPAKPAEVKVFDLESSDEARSFPVSGDQVGAIAFSNDGLLLAVGSGTQPGPTSPLKAGEVVVRQAGTGKVIQTFRGHSGVVKSLAFSPDDRRLASGGWDGAAKVWSLTDVQQIDGVAWDAARPPVVRATLGDGRLRHWEGIWAVALSPDGSRAASVSGDGQVLLHDAATGKRLRRFDGHTSGVRAVAFSPDGRRLATTGGDQTVRVWDVETGATIHALRLALSPHQSAGAGVCVAFSDDGKALAAGTEGGNRVFVWDAVTGTLRRQFPAHGAAVTALAFRPGGQQFVTGSQDGTLKVWQAASGKELRKIDAHKGQVWGLAVAGGVVFSGGEDALVKGWNPDDGKEVRLIKPEGGIVFSIAASGDGKRLITGLQSGQVKTWNAADGKPLKTLSGHTSHVHGVALSRDGARAVTGASERSVRLWDAVAAKELVEPGDGEKLAVAVSGDGKWIATGGTGPHVIRLYDARTLAPAGELKGHTSNVRGLAFLDGKTLLSAGEDGTVRGWDLETKAERKEMTRSGLAQQFRLAVSPDGKHFASGGGDGKAHLFSVGKPGASRTLEGHAGSVWGVTFVHDGLVGTASHDQTLKAWSVPDGKLMGTIKPDPAHSPWGASAADGRVVVPDEGGMARVWKDGKVVSMARVTDSPLHSAVFRGDGKLFATGDNRGRVKFWTLEGTELATVHLGPNWGTVAGLAFYPDGRRLVTANGDGTVSVIEVGGGVE